MKWERHVSCSWHGGPSLDLLLVAEPPGVTAMHKESCAEQGICDRPLNLIPTLWSLVRRAHSDPLDEARAARRQLLERYGGAIRRYLRRLLHDPHAADEVFQEFALQLLQGDLRG